MDLLRKEVKNNYDKQFTIVTTHKNVGGLRYFGKRGNIRKGCVEIEDWVTSVYFVLGI